MTDRLAAEQRAVQSGETGEITRTSRAALAYLLRQLASLSVLEGKLNEAPGLYRKSIDFEDSPDVRLELASALLRAGQPADAATEAARVTAVESKNADGWAVLGSALRSAGKEQDAVNAFTHSLELRSDNVNVAYALGASLLAVHERSKADRLFGQILTASRNDAVWHVAVGDAYREGGYLDEAVLHFKAAIARDPKAAHAEFFLGLTYLQMNQWGPNSQSFEHLRAATRLSPQDYVSNFYLGALESTDGSDLAASDRHLHAAAEADASQPEVWLYLGLNANREKNTGVAKVDLQKAIDLTGENEARNDYQVRRAYFALGRLLIAGGDRPAGEALLARYKRAEQAAVAESAAVIAQSMGTDDSSHSMAGLSSAASLSAAQPVADRPKTHDAPLTEQQREQNRASEAQLRRLLAGCYNDLGTAEARQQQYSAALTSFQQAEQWEPPSTTLLHNLGVAAFRTEKYAEAERALTIYAERVGGQADPRSRVMLAYSEFSLGRFAEAATSFATAGDAALQDSRIAYAWAFSLARSGQQQRANKIADELVPRDLSPEVLGLVCHLYVDTEDYEQSASCYRQVYAHEPSVKLAHYEVGEALIRLDRPAEAIPELRKELELSPADANVESALAFALLQTSQRPEAEAILRRVTTTSPEQPDAQYQYGKLLLDSGKTVEAIVHLEAAERLDGDKDYVHYQLQSAYRRAGRTEDAAREAAAFRQIKDRHRDDAVRSTPH